MKLTLFVAALPAASAAPTWPWTKPKPLKYPGLDVLAKKAGLDYFGTAIDNVVLDNKQYTSIANNRSEFGQVTPSNGQKWMYIEPTRNKFNYTLGDQITKPATRNRQLKRCHNFVWHNQLPEWLTSGNWTKTELIKIMENHIKNEARHYYNDCFAWDVVNEAFEDDATATLRKSIWLNVIGPEYIELAFKFARKYTKPGTKLYYNDYAIERVNNKSRAVETLGTYPYPQNHHLNKNILTPPSQGLPQTPHPHRRHRPPSPLHRRPRPHLRRAKSHPQDVQQAGSRDLPHRARRQNPAPGQRHDASAPGRRLR